jgi:hypothetical protein
LRPVVGAIALGLVPLAFAIAYVADQLQVGLRIPWDLLLTFTGGHFSFLAALLICLLGGCLLATFALSRGAGRGAHGGPVAAGQIGH